MRYLKKKENDEMAKIVEKYNEDCNIIDKKLGDQFNLESKFSWREQYLDLKTAIRNVLIRNIGRKRKKFLSELVSIQ